MVTIRMNPETKLMVITRSEDLIQRHDLTNVTKNTINNRAYVYRNGRMLEVVRRGAKSTRVRESLSDNGVRTYLVPTGTIESYHHVDGRA